MGYAIRLFATDSLSSLVPLHTTMIRQGFPVNPVGTNQLDIIYHRQYPPLTADLSGADAITTRSRIMRFIELVSRQPRSPDQQLVLDVLARTQALLTLGVPDTLTDEFAAALDNAVSIISSMAEGLFQVDGEGFYDGHTLILRIAS